MVSREEKKELEKIRKSTNEPRDEEKIVPVVENNNQYKIALPKKFTDYLKYKKNKNQNAKITLIKKEKKLIIEIG